MQYQVDLPENVPLIHPFWAINTITDAVDTLLYAALICISLFSSQFGKLSRLPAQKALHETICAGPLNSRIDIYYLKVKKKYNHRATKDTKKTGVRFD